jgi:hypothetical protein
MLPSFPPLDPAWLLAYPESVTPSAPWCVRLDNLELGVLLLTQPWLAGEGLRRADLERQLGRLGATLPLGAVYFQRVKRAVARLEEVGALLGIGEGRARRFVLAPEGFAALMVNLRVLAADPTLDGSEFELKRALVALWNLVFDRLSEAGEEDEETGPRAPAAEAFFAAVEALRLFDQTVVTEDGLREALDVLRLIALQREAVEQRLAEVRGPEAAHPVQSSEPRDSFRVTTRLEPQVGYRFEPEQLREEGLTEAAELLAASPEAAALLRDLTVDVLPTLAREGAVLRYERYLEYLEGLARLHAGALGRVSLDAVRALFSPRRS